MKNILHCEDCAAQLWDTFTKTRLEVLYACSLSHSVLYPFHRAQNTGGIDSQDSHLKSLFQPECFPRFSHDLLYLPAEFIDQLEG